MTTPQPPPRPAPAGDELFPRSLAILDDGARQQTHLGVQLYVSLRGTVLIHRAFGERRPGEPLTVDTLSLWLSAGKPLTALAIAQQWERGRLDLDAPVSRYLPEFGTAGKSRITVRHLLTHTGGFRPADTLPETLPWDTMLQATCRTPLEPGWVPGVTAGYHLQGSWYVLAEIVQRLDGRVFPHYLRDEILLPLGLRDSWIGMPPATYAAYGPRIGPTYLAFPHPIAPHPTWDSAAACTACRPGGNARGPVHELGRFYEALLEGGRGIVRPATLREFVRRQRVGVFDQTFRHVVDVGLGFVLNSSHHGLDTVPYGYGRHASEETFGHSGSQSACAFADPVRGLVVAWVFNGQPGEPRHQRRQRALNTALYEDLRLETH